jgi:hypothetical protein
MIEIDEVQSAGLDHRLLRVDHGVQDRVESLVLVECRGADGLLPHGTLVSVSGTLVVVRVGNQASHHSEDGEGVDLHVSVLWMAAR